jgi:hypothetical protein
MNRIRSFLPKSPKRQGLARYAHLIAAVAVGGGVLGKKWWNRRKGNEAA